MCGQSFLKVNWACKQCEVSSPTMIVDLSTEEEHVISVSAVEWRLDASPVTPLESNAVNGTILIDRRQAFPP